ncbi:2TM domain-containing protein [Niallia taxi]|uniref:2TM domain-containing protein n=1 Tax=Niallia taxi TaxID=2499688 RepID=UPI0015F61565|nr:2TM domain-containing protein [Niallia taxi]
MSQLNYEQAKKRVRELKIFYGHFIFYILVNIMLFIINIMSSPGSWWFIYPLFGWGLGILVHVTYTYVFSRWGSEWEERKIKELLSKDR